MNADLNLNIYAAIWVLASIAAILVSVFILRESQLDWKVWKDSDNGWKDVIKSTTRRELFRIFEHVLYLVVGLPALFTPTSFSAVAMLLVIGRASVAVNSFLDLLSKRKQVARYLRKERDPSQPETTIQRQDREVGDERREKQKRDKT